MKLSIKKEKVKDINIFIRRCGYGLLRNRKTGEVTFVKRLSRDLYPRYHIYVHETPSEFFLNLHLDQRQTVYKGATAHAGEYDGPLIQKEALRIDKMAKIC